MSELSLNAVVNSGPINWNKNIPELSAIEITYDYDRNNVNSWFEDDDNIDGYGELERDKGLNEYGDFDGNAWLSQFGYETDEDYYIYGNSGTGYNPAKAVNDRLTLAGSDISHSVSEISPLLPGSRNRITPAISSLVLSAAIFNLLWWYQSQHTYRH